MWVWLFGDVRTCRYEDRGFDREFQSTRQQRSAGVGSAARHRAACGQALRLQIHDRGHEHPRSVDAATAHGRPPAALPEHWREGGAWPRHGESDLPGFISINTAKPSEYAAAQLPAVFDGTPVGVNGEDMSRATISHAFSDHLTMSVKRRQFDLSQVMNRNHPGLRGDNAQLEDTIQTMELGFCMQAAVPDLPDLSQESNTTLERCRAGQIHAVGTCKGSNGCLPTPRHHGLGGYKTWLGTNRVEREAPGEDHRTCAGDAAKCAWCAVRCFFRVRAMVCCTLARATLRCRQTPAWLNQIEAVVPSLRMSRQAV